MAFLSTHFLDTSLKLIIRSKCLTCLALNPAS